MRKLAFMRSPQGGAPMWNGHVRYQIPGVSPSHSVYDTNDGYAHDDFNPSVQVRAGEITTRGRHAVTMPTTTRQTRIGAQFSSLAAGAVWQSAFSPTWEHLIPGTRPNLGELRTLNMNNNPNTYGSLEQQRATVYNPWPSAGAIYPKAI